MKTEHLGRLVVTLTILVTLIGMPIQIVQNYVSQRSSFHISVTLSVLIVYLVWVWYGVQKPDKYVAISNAVGGLFAFILFLQSFYYDGVESPFRLFSHLIKLLLE
jgi:hypothetical protein